MMSEIHKPRTINTYVIAKALNDESRDLSRDEMTIAVKMRNIEQRQKTGD